MPRETASALRKRWLAKGFIEERSEILAQLRLGGELSGPIDLRGIIFGGADQLETLPQSSLISTNLSEVDFGNSTLAVRLNEAHLANCAFDDVVFDRCAWFDARVVGCSFVGAQFRGGHLDRSEFVDCDFSRARFAGVRGEMGGGRQYRFENCVFSGTSFTGTELRGVEFQQCVFENVLFKGCYLLRTKFVGAAPGLEAFKNCSGKATNLDGKIVAFD